jgi:thymidylate synthase
MSLWNPETIGKSLLPPCHGVSSSFRFQDGAFLQHVSAKRRCLPRVTFQHNVVRCADVWSHKFVDYIRRPEDRYGIHTSIRRMMRVSVQLQRTDGVTYVDYERRYRQHHGIQDRRFYYREYKHHPAIKASICWEWYTWPLSCSVPR